MLITFRGRVSGKHFTTPIGYLRQGKTVDCFTDHRWSKNLVTRPEVTLLIQGRRSQGTAEVIRDERETVARALLEYCTPGPMAARAFHVELDASGKPVPESARREALRLTLVRVTLR